MTCFAWFKKVILVRKLLPHAWKKGYLQKSVLKELCSSLRDLFTKTNEKAGEIQLLDGNIHYRCKAYPYLSFSRDPIGFQSGSSSWTSQLSIRGFNLSSGYQRSLDDSTLDIEFTSIFCFIISTLLVFILSLSLALVMLKCYDYFKARNTQVFEQLFLCNSCNNCL